MSMRTTSPETVTGQGLTGVSGSAQLRAQASWPQARIHFPVPTGKILEAAGTPGPGALCRWPLQTRLSPLRGAFTWPCKNQVVSKLPAEMKLPHRGDNPSPSSPRLSGPGQGKPGLHDISCVLLFPSQVTPSLTMLKRPRPPSKTVSSPGPAARGSAAAAVGQGFDRFFGTTLRG